MSASELTTSNSTPPGQEPPFLRFPPFPEPPAGVTIMPFKNFKPRGIQLFSESKRAGDNDAEVEEEDAELDALGIPTVELRVKHTTDECKSSSRKKRKKKKAAAADTITPMPVKKLKWYEEWEEGEDLRVTKAKYDPNIPPVDRFFQAAYDFRTGRPWPPVLGLNLNNLWDQFRVFSGLLVNPSIYRKVGSKKYERAESPDFVSDDEDDPPMNIRDEANDRPAKRQRSGDCFDGGDDESPFCDPQKLDEEVREEKVSAFLSDPEKASKIFLSSYMRSHGLVWEINNLINTPRLIFFFLAFVVRNRVLQEPTYQRGLKRALGVIEWAKKELPLAHQIGQSIADDQFHEACRECFGRQGSMNWAFVSATDTTTEQKDASATIINTDLSDGTTSKITLPSEDLVHLKDAIEDNVDMDVSISAPSTLVSPPSEDAPAQNSGGWGGDGWGENGSSAGWGGGESWGVGGTWTDSTHEGQDSNANLYGADAEWGTSNPSWARDPISLLSSLGPSAFPLTHTTGIVEFSTRRVSAIHFPPDHPKGVPLSCAQRGLGGTAMTAGDSQGWVPSADGVEAELEMRFAKVVLEPWGREEGDIGRPEISRTSRGPVIDPNSNTPSKKAPTDVTTGARTPHNPLTDNITLLVDPSFAEMLSLAPGLGLAAVWIEIARQKNRGCTDAMAKGGAAPVDYDTPGRFWYHEDVTGIFPSFYTPGEE